MEYVLANTSKVVMAVKDGNNLMYIPLDKLMDNKGGRGGPKSREDAPGQCDAAHA